MKSFTRITFVGLALEQEIKKMEANNIENDALNLRILKNYLRCPNETYKNVYSRTSSCLNTRR